MARTVHKRRRNRREQELVEARAHVEARLDTYPGAVGRVGRDHRVLFVSKHALELVDLSATDVIGHTAADLGLDDRIVAIWHEMLDEAFESGASLTRDVSAALPVGYRRLEVTVVPERARGGEVDSVLVFARDVTAERREHDELARVRRLARFGSWQWTPESARVTASPELYEMFGLDAHRGPLGIDDWMTGVHRDDVDRVRAMVRHSWDSGVPLSFECRVVLTNGATRWVVVLGEPVRDTAGTLLGLDGITLDVTALRAAEAEVHATEAELRATLDSSPNAVVRFDRDLRIEFANRRLLALLELDLVDVVGRTLAELHSPAGLTDRWHGLLRRVFSGETATDEFPLEVADGLRWFRATAVPQPGSRGPADYAIVVGIDVTEEHRTRSRLETAERLAHVGSWSVDLRTGEAQVSRELSRILGIEDVEGFSWSSLVELVHPDDQELVAELQERLTATWEPCSIECRVVRADGTVRTVLAHIEPVFDEAGETQALVGAVTDVSELREAERELVEREERLRALLDHSRTAIVRFDRGLRIVGVNEAALQFSGMPRDQVVGGTSAQLGYPEDLVEYLEGNLRRVLDTAEAQTYEYRAPGADGDYRWFESNAAPELGPDGSVQHVVVSSYDVTGRKRVEEELAHQILHDGLTGLINRQGLIVEVQRALGRQCRTRTPAALLMLDLDRFKVVNESLGHAAGDDLLKQAARRLEVQVPRTGALARMGGDEYGVLLEELADETEPARIATRFVHALREPFEIDGRQVVATGSVGIVVSADDGSDDPGVLLSHADAAMYLAKERGRDRYEFFDERLRLRVDERLDLESELRRATDRDELLVHYQPEVDLESGRIVGAEALLRWKHPRHGLLSVSDSIRIAEESGFIQKVGELVIDEVCAQMARWKALGLSEHFVLSTNVSPVQLADRNFPDIVRRAMEHHGVVGGELCIEVVETTLMIESPTVVENLRVLDEELGIEFAIDDFGTGYSSLMYIKRLPALALKVDRSFVAGLPDDADDRAIVASVVALARALGLTTTAEGVENEAQATALRTLGVERAQGFLYAPALPADLMTELLREPTPPWGVDANVKPAAGEL